MAGLRYVLSSDWGAPAGGALSERQRHWWAEYAGWHLALPDGARDETTVRYASVNGDFRRVHRFALIACVQQARSSATGRSTSRGR